MDLRLRPVRDGDEAAVRRAQLALEADDFSFGLTSVDEPWPSFTQRVARQSTTPRTGDGPVASTFLVAVLDGEVVGRTSIRHWLNSRLLLRGGHIGFGVVPWARRRGCATEILRQSLIIARSLGVDDVLVTCDETNVGSKRAIERCGGELDATVNPDDGGEPWRRYWIG